MRQLVTGLCATLLAGAAQAGLVVNSIDLVMVETDFNSRQDVPGILDDEAAALWSFTQGFLPFYNDPATLLCEQSLQAFEGISARQTCGGDRRDNGTLFAITGSATGDNQLQFGLDWGRGGFTFLALDGFAPEVERYNSDIWWRRNWNHGDVIDLFIPETDNFLLLGLGFEGCCDGINSARWRSLDGGNRNLNEGPGEWQTLAVNNVPEPGVLGLFAAGLAGVMVTGRRKSRTGSAKSGT